MDKIEFISAKDARIDNTAGRESYSYLQSKNIKNDKNFRACSGRGLDVLKVKVGRGNPFKIDIFTLSGQCVNIYAPRNTKFIYTKYGRKIETVLEDFISLAKRDNWLVECGEFILSFLVDNKLLEFVDFGGPDKICVPRRRCQFLYDNVGNFIFESISLSDWEYVDIIVYYYFKCNNHGDIGNKHCHKEILIEQFADEIDMSDFGRSDFKIICRGCMSLNFQNQMKERVEYIEDDFYHRLLDIDTFEKDGKKEIEEVIK